ncbi:MAG: hypothetical protein WD077_14385 [Bacteroidia bacterium]
MAKHNFDRTQGWSGKEANDRSKKQFGPKRDERIYDSFEGSSMKHGEENDKHPSIAPGKYGRQEYGTNNLPVNARKDSESDGARYHWGDASSPVENHGRPDRYGNSSEMQKPHEQSGSAESEGDRDRGISEKGEDRSEPDERFQRPADNYERYEGWPVNQGGYSEQDFWQNEPPRNSWQKQEDQEGSQERYYEGQPQTGRSMGHTHQDYSQNWNQNRENYPSSAERQYPQYEKHRESEINTGQEESASKPGNIPVDEKKAKDDRRSRNAKNGSDKAKPR